MRVIKAVLFVAVLVCCLTSAFAQCNAATSIQSQDGLGCICASGYTGATCTNPSQGSCTSPVLSRVEATNFPSLSATASDTYFTNNILTAHVEAVYVANRQYNELKFTPLTGKNESNACALGTTGSYWAQTRPAATGGASCNDSFVLNMPWAFHTDCGFSNNTGMSNADYMYITGYLHIKYTDWLGPVDSFNLTRTTKVPYSITVKFQKHVTVTLKPLNVTSDVRFGMALTEDLFDPVSSQLTLQLTTIINWPNMFWSGSDNNGEGTHLYTPDQVALLPLQSTSVNGQTGQAYDATPVVCASKNSCPDQSAQGLYTFPAYDPNTCGNTSPGSTCKQQWTWIATLSQQASGLTASGQPKNCSFDGDYFFNVVLYTCRAAGGPNSAPSCTNQALNITYTIQDSFVCGVLDITPSVGGKLYAFSSDVTSGFRALVGHSDTTHFSLGTSGNFYAQIDSDGNDISIVFTDISFKTQETGAQWNYLWQNSAPFSASVAPYISVNNTAKFFSVYFHSSTFKVQPNSQTVYTFSATVTISFKGNPNYDPATTESKKRTVQMEWTQATAAATTNVFMSGAAAPKAADVAAPNAGVSSVTFIASVVGAVAGTMIIVFVVVGLALRARSTKEDGMSASLMAASAAASEVVANRA